MNYNNVVAYVVREVPKIDHFSSALSNLDMTIRDQFRQSRGLVDHMPMAQNEVLGQASVLSDKTKASLNPRNLTEFLMEQFSVVERAFKAIQNASYKTLGFWGYVKRFFLKSCLESKIFQVMRSLMNLQRIECLRTRMSGLLLFAFKDSTKNQNVADCKTLSARITDFYSLRQAIPLDWKAQFRALQKEYGQLVRNANAGKKRQLQVGNLGAERLPAIGKRLERIRYDVDGYTKLFRGLKNKDVRLLEGVPISRFRSYDLTPLIRAADLTLEKIKNQGEIGSDEKAFIDELQRISEMLPNFRSSSIEKAIDALRTLRQIEAFNQDS